MSRIQSLRMVAPATRRMFSAATARSAKYSEFTVTRAHAREHAEETAELWRKISIYVCIPALIAGGYNAYRLFQDHMHHLQEHPVDPEAPQMQYQNYHARDLPFGNGYETLFWNPKFNFPKPS